MHSVSEIAADAWKANEDFYRQTFRKQGVEDEWAEVLTLELCKAVFLKAYMLGAVTMRRKLLTASGRTVQ